MSRLGNCVSDNQSTTFPLDVLVIESEASVRERIREVLAAEKHRVRLMSSFSESICENFRHELDVILFGTELPNENALTLLQRLRSFAPHTVIVIATENPNFEDAVQALHAGAYDYLLKPINAEMLRATFQRIRQLNQAKQSLKLETDARHHAESQHRMLAEAISHLGEGVVITEMESDGSCPRIVFVNEAICQITGYQESELLGETPEIFHGEDTDSQSIEEVYQAIHSHRPFHGDLLFYRKDGTTYDAEIICTPMLDASGHCTNYVSVHRDISEKKRSARQLQERESLLRAILQTATDAIVTINHHGTIVGVNLATLQMFGFEEDELIGSNVSMLMPAPFRDEHDGYITRYLEMGTPRVIGTGREIVALRKNGSTFPVHLSISQIDHPPLFTGIVRDISALRDLQKQVLEIAAEEDRRIGHELHDSVQQQLTGLGLLAQTVSEMLLNSEQWDAHCQPTVAKVARLADRVARGISEAAREVHNLSRGLVPVEIDAEGLRASLEELAERVGEQCGIECQCEFTGDTTFENNFVATHLFRIVQEAVTNAMKHGHATQIKIRLIGTEPSITMEILDNGCGISAHPVSNLGTGLRIMQYRCNLIGGVVKIGPGSVGGTLVTCIVPRDGSFEVEK